MSVEISNTFFDSSTQTGKFINFIHHLSQMRHFKEGIFWYWWIYLSKNYIFLNKKNKLLIIYTRIIFLRKFYQKIKYFFLNSFSNFSSLIVSITKLSHSIAIDNHSSIDIRFFYYARRCFFVNWSKYLFILPCFHQSIFLNNFNAIYPKSKSTTKRHSLDSSLITISQKHDTTNIEFERSAKSPPPQIPIEFRGQWISLDHNRIERWHAPWQRRSAWQAGFATPCSVSVDAGVVSAPLVPTMWHWVHGSR